MAEKYNGWKNYETWAVSLWIDNEESTYLRARAIAQEARADPQIIDGRTAPGVVADCLKEWIENDSPLNNTATLYADLLNAALSEVDWYEIAEHYLNEVP
jgi:hypothetical protein